MFTYHFRIQNWRNVLGSVACCGLVSFRLLAQQPANNTEAEAAYTRTLTQRAEKIVARLGLKDAAKAERVRHLIEQQYRQLSAIHAERDARIKAAKAVADGDSPAAEVNIRTAQAAARASLDKQHAWFLSQLSSNLAPAQVEGVKDGMTYGVVQVTYNTYLKMLPDLTDTQKQQIITWLMEARELAMDEGTSDEKHKVFGKYKGRINNYLAAAGYKLKEAEKNLKTSKPPASGTTAK